ncbi:hypothetical protein HU200_067835 [Digitaria exilis]|uniref:HTH myb-type domain-containing protein n=1 Tax=Digitaria exilis TaxID=1010633 RepID=A0A834ZVM6_9POAL|nr:hypothetical protein HU200_067835 [Digitaria exilis]
MGRAPCCDKASVKKGPLVTGGGRQAQGLKRCGKSCRLRWLNYLRPNIRHGGFLEEEDRIILSLYVSNRQQVKVQHRSNRPSAFFDQSTVELAENW